MNPDNLYIGLLVLIVESLLNLADCSHKYNSEHDERYFHNYVNRIGKIK